MNSNPERRNKARFEHESKIALENSEIGVQRGARMYNFSDYGMYFEADIRLEQDTEIRVGIRNSPFATEHDKFESYRGVIKWRKALKESSYIYGYGVELASENAQSDKQQNFQWSREHPREDCNIPVKYKVEHRSCQGTAENVSKGGVAVKAEDPAMIGQQITIDIPLKKKGKIARLNGKIAWSDRKSFGVKFLRTK